MDIENSGERRVCKKKFARQKAEISSFFSADSMNLSVLPMVASANIRTTDVDCPKDCPGGIPKTFSILGIEIPRTPGCPMEGDIE